MIGRRFLASCVLFLTGCAGLGNDGRGFPSLAKRPFEREGQVAAPAPVFAPAVQDADWDQLLASLSDLTAKARKGGADFDSLYGRVSARVDDARGAAVSSESWVVANADLSKLENARYACVTSLANLDRLYTDRMAAMADGKVNGGVREIDAARREVVALVDRQNDRLDALRASLREP